MAKPAPVTLHGHQIGATTRTPDNTHEAWILTAGLGYTPAGGYGQYEFDTQTDAEQAVITEHHRITR